jgi:pyruvate ferredoxin oxidoreductase gamma subunit
VKNMKDMFEIRIHGRGGQGAKTAAQFIVEAALEKGKYIQSFPEYGPERSGAPMRAFARLSDKPIRTYAPIVSPDVVMVIDPTLLEGVNVTEGLTKEGILIVNTPNGPEWVKEKTKFRGRCMTVDATKISLESVGKNLPNTPMIGALIKATECIDLKAIEESIRNKFLKKIGEEKTNATIRAVDRAYNEAR